MSNTFLTNRVQTTTSRNWSISIRCASDSTFTNYITCCIVGSGAGFPVSSPEQTQRLLGNGEWPTSEVSAPPSPTDQPRAAGEFTDFNPKLAYRMESKPRGMAIIINNRHFTCGMKERVGMWLFVLTL